MCEVYNQSVLGIQRRLQVTSPAHLPFVTKLWTKEKETLSKDATMGKEHRY